ncbi:MAG: hypothetical protein ACI9XC_001096 [Gammaproteobacteria bacterium]|jgi:hypothetical protein
MTISNKYTIISGILILGIGTISQAEMYKWVDENGVTQFTQSRPPGETDVEIIEVKTKPASTSALKNLESQIKRADGLREKRLETEENKRIDKENQAVVVENCRRSRARLQSYSVPNALREQEDGSRARVDEDARQRELVAAREMVQKYCN